MILAGERPVPVPHVHRKCRDKYQTKSVTAVCYHVHTKHINTLRGQNVELCVKSGGSYNNHWTFKS